jgi:hypothetical protein
LKVNDITEVEEHVSSEMSLTFSGLGGVIYWKIELFMAEASYVVYPKGF